MLQDSKILSLNCLKILENSNPNFKPKKEGEQGNFRSKEITKERDKRKKRKPKKLQTHRRPSTTHTLVLV